MGVLGFEKRVNSPQTISTRSGIDLQFTTRAIDSGVEVIFTARTRPAFLLHWGIRAGSAANWASPPPEFWPPGSQTGGGAALQSPFYQDNGGFKLTLRIPAHQANGRLEFDLYFPADRRWDNNGNRNYQVPLNAKPMAQAEALAVGRPVDGAELLFDRVFELEPGAQLAVWTAKAAERHLVNLSHNLTGNWVLHWGIARRSPSEWLLPPETERPPGSIVVDERAVQTPFAQEKGAQSLRLEFAGSEVPLGLQFVLRQTDNGGRWLKCRGANFFVPVQAPKPATAGNLGELAGLAEEIIRPETTHNSWTLMHRFNLCHDLLDWQPDDPGALSLIYVWLRFSAIRQLTWQKNYNTKPRELAHAQDRLTQKLAGMYRHAAAGRPLLRLMLATVGRGGEGQRIRDEILNIMHRHHIKEVSGHFLEEWHQKLHNNTTPDDIVICEAYLEFLRSHGNRDRFYQVLEAGGVTRQRLENFERPIRSQPDFVPHLRDALLNDFGYFLKILKAAHSGTDFETALGAARHCLDGGLQGLLDWIAGHRFDDGDRMPELVSQITEARRRLAGYLPNHDGLRELLYLDLALEQLLRTVIERNLQHRPGGEALAGLIARVLANITLSYEDPELAACSNHWQRLQTVPRFNQEWALHAKSVTDRAARGLSAWIDRFYQLLQPKAEYLGTAFQAESWTVTLFSEEVIRGSSLGFVLSMLLRQLDPLLRQTAQLGAWQIISRGRAAGSVEVVESLQSIQRESYAQPVVIVADRITGDEEIPAGVTAVLAPDVTDVVSHVAVRARNAGVLFAACYDPELLAQIKALRGRPIQLDVNAAGDVLFQETAAAAAAPSGATPTARIRLTPRRFTRFALALDESNQQQVGGKSLHQAELRGRLAESVGLPRSAAVPFGVFEHVLSLAMNREPAQRYAQKVAEVEAGGAAVLAELRQIVLSLQAPDEFKSALQESFQRAQLSWPEDWATAWLRIKQVWASKWNDRACLSRQKLGIPHASLNMAVLIQEVVPAEYAFVIHTVNPANGDPQQLFAEVVLGLGETLVGNYPGRALSFVSHKSGGAPVVHSFPGKSQGLFGGGLIFRSDSNGEDLEGYAGAGLYDSVLLTPPRTMMLDYTQERLVWDEAFRRELLESIARVGLAVERACGSPQDIEGAIAQGRCYVVQTRPQAGVK